MEKATEIRRRNQDRLLYTNSRGGSLDARGHPWESVPFKHPSTFDTLAMDPVRKKQIKDDLDDFANGQLFYQKTGRTWKRGYLLYGPPGTGKSSMIAATANYLGYIYDLELTEVQNNSELRKLLMKTSSKSIIVIEDIDCSVNLTNRKKMKISNNQSFENCYDPKIRRGGGREEGSFENCPPSSPNSRRTGHSRPHIYRFSKFVIIKPTVKSSDHLPFHGSRIFPGKILTFCLTLGFPSLHFPSLYPCSSRSLFPK